MPLSADFERHLNLVPSVVFNGVRVRTLFDTLHFRPPHETFHEFLLRVIQWTLGETWWKHQLAASVDSRHAVVSWYLQYCEFTRNRTSDATVQSDGVTHRSRATGPLWALLTLGYDLFCLQVKRELPNFVVERLRSRASFQGMRYELTAAAILLRAGFQLEYLDERQIKEKHGEFLARHASSGQQFVVEAKTRVRSGVLHSAGTFEYKRDVRGLEDLVRNALKKRPVDTPFVIFLDVNFPPSPDVPVLEKAWINDIKGVLSLLGTPTADTPDRFSLLVVTNFAYHLGAEDARVPQPEWTLVLPRFASIPLDAQALESIDASLQSYGIVPDEL